MGLVGFLTVPIPYILKKVLVRGFSIIKCKIAHKSR